MKLKLLGGALALVLVCAAYAGTLTANLTVDNGFNIYISTNDSVQGTYFGTGDDLTQTYTYLVALTPDVNNYIHVVATNGTGPAGFIGDFSLSGTDFEFGNDTQYLLTGTAYWGASATGFGSYSTPYDEDAWGVNPAWNNGPLTYPTTGMDPNAHWIWDAAPACLSCTRYFSTEIYPTVPEPATFGILGAGLALLWRKRASRR